MTGHEAHFGPDGPVAGAQAWLELVLLERGLAAAWPLTEPEYRRRLAAAWIAGRDRWRPADAGRSRDLLAALTAEEPAEEDAWLAFADAQVREFRRVCRYVDLRGSSWASVPQVESPGCELVVLAEAGELHGLEEPGFLPAYGLLMRHEPAWGWRVAELR